MDIAAEVIEYLDAHTTVTWHHDRPTGNASEYGTVTRDGGPTEMVRDQPTLTLMAYAQTRGRCADLAQEAKRALLNMPWVHPNVFRAQVLGDYYDPVDGMRRHRITAQLITND